MQNVRRYADVIASLEGVLWLSLAWSISLSAHMGSTEPTLASLLVIGALVVFCWAHRPLRYLLGRYHIRKRRTDMCPATAVGDVLPHYAGSPVRQCLVAA